MSKRYIVVITLLLIGIMIMFCLNLSVGAVDIPFSAFVDILKGGKVENKSLKDEFRVGC